MYPRSGAQRTAFTQTAPSGTCQAEYGHLVPVREHPGAPVRGHVAGCHACSFIIGSLAVWTIEL